MRKIHITEAQFECIKKNISEANGQAYEIDLTNRIEQKGGNVNQALNDLNSENPTAANDIRNGKARTTFDPEAVQTNEGRTYTKKQIKEERVRNLKKQCVRVTKKNLR